MAGPRSEDVFPITKWGYSSNRYVSLPEANNYLLIFSRSNCTSVMLPTKIPTSCPQNGPTKTQVLKQRSMLKHDTMKLILNDESEAWSGFGHWILWVLWVGSSHLGWFSGDRNHGDRKSPNWGCWTPCKWPNFMAYKWG